MAAGPGVLVVDDDPDIRTFTEAALEDSGYEVRSAANGGVPLTLLQEWQPNVILLDLMMPCVDGWTFRQAQLVQERLAAIPLVVMSAGYRPQDEAQKLAAAATLAKPFDLDELLNTVARLTG
jgi:CheY-like chemotaxis protein